jgi:hypothetical protein
MRSTILTCVTGIILLVSFYACAQTRNTSSKKLKDPITILDASMQRQFGGVRASGPVISYYLTVIWNGQDSPGGFFWKTDNKWMPCSIYKPGSKGVLDPQFVGHGDTLELVPARKGSTTTPAEIPMQVNNAIFYKTNNSSWRYAVVTNIRKKPDVVMP